MQPCSNTIPVLLVRLAMATGSFFCLNPTLGQDYLTPSDVVVGTEQASQETLSQTAGKGALRFLGLDIFPRASVTAMYDDNILITSTNPLNDVEWTVSPGLTVAAGDVSLYLPGSVTLGQIRNLLNYSLLDETPKPERYLGVDYTPSANFFTDHSRYNNVDHTAGMSAGYSFARLVLGLDQDYTRWAVKDNSVGDRITREFYNTQLRSRYELTDRSAVEVNCRYVRLAYVNGIYQGYQEFRNEDWFDRKVGARLEMGGGLAFGFVYPQSSPDQTYQRAYVRGIYWLSGKLNVRANAGAEWRQYGAGQGDTIDPVFSLQAIYRPRVSTLVTLEGRQRTAPSFGADYNYEIYGLTVGVEQQLTGELSAELTCRYEHVDYIHLGSGTSNNRSDDNFAVRANLTYEFSTHLKAALFYNRNQDDSNLSRYTYTDNMVGLQSSWRF